MIRKPTFSDILTLIFLAIIWASAFPAMKVAVAETGPLWLITGRITLAFLFLLPIALYRGLSLPRDTHQWFLLIVIAFLNAVAPHFLISWGQQYLTASAASILMGLGPLTGLLLSHVLTQDDRLTWGKMLGVVLGFSGVIVLIGPDAFSGLSDNLMAQGAMLAGVFCYAFSGILIRRMTDIPPLRLSTLVLGMAMIGLFFYLAIVQPALPAALSDKGLFALIYLGILPTGVGYIIRYAMIRKVGYSYFSLSVNLIPLFGVILGVLLLNEPLQATLLIALALILSGLFVAQRYGASGKHKKRDQDLNRDQTTMRPVQETQRSRQHP